MSHITDDNCIAGKEVHRESRILSNGRPESALSMKLGLSNMSLRGNDEKHALHHLKKVKTIPM
jgi:hypothetical protein